MKRTPTMIVVAVIAMFGSLSLMHTKTSAAANHPAEIYGSNPDNPSLQRQIVSKEREMLDALKTGNLELFGKLTAENAVFVDARGPASKAQLLKNVVGFTISDYSMDGMNFVPLSANSGLISYRINEKGVSRGKEFTAQVYVSSIWANRAGNWVCLFSEETPVRWISPNPL